MLALPTARPIWRTVLSAVALIYGFACLGSGLDRLSAYNPMLEKFVPGPFRAHAETGRAALTFTEKKPGMLRSAARRAVLADPIERRPAALLGTGYLLTGDYPAAAAAFQVGARLGWREPITQHYWYQVALEIGDYPRAAERVDALLRTQTGQAKADKLLEPLLSAAAGRQALATRLADRPAWLQNFLAPHAKVQPGLLINRSEVVQLMRRAQGPLHCEDVVPLVGAISKSGMPKRARGLWSIHCGTGQASGTVWEAGFAGLRNARYGGAVGWRLHRTGDLSATLVDDPQGRVGVAVQNFGLVTRLSLSQMVNLAPGAYRVIVAAKPDQSGMHGKLVPSLTCGNRPERPDPGSADSGHSDIVRAGSCKISVFALWLPPSPETIVVSSVQLQKID